MRDRLAILGGEKSVAVEFKRYNSIGLEEYAAVNEVMKSGVLSQFLGCWSPDFFGGAKIQGFEHAWAKQFKVAHAISMNSNTSGLIAALGAIELEPGDEVIVSPWTMCASATSILIWNAIPVFADIEQETFNLDPIDVKRKITSRTKAIVVTDIFGHSADLTALWKLAREHNLYIIEDCAQAPGAIFKGNFVGTNSHIGVFSLNYHKHIHTGEGGVCVTDDAKLAERIQLIRNHAEAVVENKGVQNLINMIGFNFRLTEMQAAIGIEQLKKLPDLTESRINAAKKLTEGLCSLKGIRPPVVKENCTHVYYDYPLVLDIKAIGVDRNRIVEALKAEGIPNISGGYQLLYDLPMYKNRIAYGKNGFPWKGLARGDSFVTYERGSCPVAEDLHFSSYLGIEFCAYEFGDQEIAAYISGFQKVWRNLNHL